MIEPVRTTLMNPGSAGKVRIPTVRTWLKKTLIYVSKGRLRMSFFFFVAEGLNICRSFRKSAGRLECSVCINRVPFFLHHASDLRISWNAVCPNCNSRSRHRGLWYLYGKVLDEISTQLKILHVAPEPIFYPLFKANERVSYITADYLLEDVDYKEDLQKLSFGDASFDLILCNHVIEHVPDDDAAFSEISRVLNAGGRAIITIPGDYSRNKTVYFNHLRFNGHYRDYGMDVVDKMNKYFSEVIYIDLSTFNSKALNYGIKANELAFVCTK
ncbi:MAG: class I SAM-dependent methyltransferase [Cyclobacteriaceae bacterium]|nr:MAG: class I SAM-dependent methyltransferase [Cyclobacteriaceae bacterium]